MSSIHIPESASDGSDVEDTAVFRECAGGYSRSERLGARRGRGLVVAAGLATVVLVGGAVAFHRLGMRAVSHASTSQDIKLQGKPITDFSDFDHRLQAFTAGKSWREVCHLYDMVVSYPCVWSPDCPQELIDLTNYYLSATEGGQAAIQSLIAASKRGAGERCEYGGLGGFDMDTIGVTPWVVQPHLTEPPVVPIPRGDLSQFMTRIDEFASGKSRGERCLILKQIQAQPCEVGWKCPSEVRALSMYYRDNIADQAVIREFMLQSASPGDSDCVG